MGCRIIKGGEMKGTRSKIGSVAGQESGAALVMVVLITFLLGTACIAMLSAAGASARNTTDVLSETKAYYAAESGIQAAVNALRYKGVDGNPVNYKVAVNNFANNGDLSAWLVYADCDTDGVVDRVLVNGSCENGYSVTVRDPDDSQTSLTYGTSGAQFRVVNADGTFGAWGAASRQFGSGDTASTLAWVPNPTNPVNLAFDADTPSVNSLIGSLRITNGATGGTAMTTATEFRVFYQLALPGNPGWSIFGKVAADGVVTVQSARFVVTGSEVELCGNTNTCGTITQSLAGLEEAEVSINGLIKPKEPHRLLVTSTGFGPNRSTKVLEAVLQKSPLDGMNSVSPFTMLGPCGTIFEAGRSNTTTYTGVSDGGVVAPAFAFTNTCNLGTAQSHINQHLTPNPNSGQPPQVSPPPASFETYQLPEWQRTPLQMDEKVQLYRAQAQSTSTYYNPHPGPKITNPGYVAGQTGPMTSVTFCEGNCTVDGDLGGGVLVVTGKLTSLGGFGFKGLILVTGAGGWERAGGGCGRIIGNVVIAPYASADFTNNVFTIPPVYAITGAGCSGVEYAGLDDLFQGENAAQTNFIRGVAEK